MLVLVVNSTGALCPFRWLFFYLQLCLCVRALVRERLYVHICTGGVGVSCVSQIFVYKRERGTEEGKKWKNSRTLSRGPVARLQADINSYQQAVCGNTRLLRYLFTDCSSGDPLPSETLAVNNEREREKKNRSREQADGNRLKTFVIWCWGCGNAAQSHARKHTDTHACAQTNIPNKALSLMQHTVCLCWRDKKTER